VSRRGLFVTLEGIDRSGKSTQARMLADALAPDALAVREPGGTHLGEQVRTLVKDAAVAPGPRAEALLFAAARADHVETLIRPAIEAGTWVLSDRFVDSSLAYQGGAGGLGIAAVRAINAFAIGDWFPDRTLVLALAEGGARARARDNEDSDRIGGRPDGYHQKVDLAFRQIAAEEAARVRIVDASGDQAAVSGRLLAELADLLP